MATVVLLVEDEFLVQELLDAAFAAAGFELVAAANGTQAFAALDADAGRFVAVVTDIKLGSGPDGWAVGRRARELVPDMPVVYLSGDSAYQWASKGVPNSVMIAKPFPSDRLITALSTLIARTKAARLSAGRCAAPRPAR
jgi:DNA-binding NtrC family response regulator